MDRRQFLSAGSATALGLPLLSGCTTTAPVTALVTQPPAATGLGDTALNTLFDRIFDERMNASPGFATALGLDKDAKAALRSTFDPKPYPQARAEDVARNSAALSAVRAVPPASLSPSSASKWSLRILSARETWAISSPRRRRAARRSWPTVSSGLSLSPEISRK